MSLVERYSLHRYQYRNEGQISVTHICHKSTKNLCQSVLDVDQHDSNVSAKRGTDFYHKVKPGYTRGLENHRTHF